MSEKNRESSRHRSRGRHAGDDSSASSTTSSSGSSNQSGGNRSARSSRGAFIMPVYKFAIIFDQVKIVDRKVTVIKQVQQITKIF